MNGLKLAIVTLAAAGLWAAAPSPTHAQGRAPARTVDAFYVGDAAYVEASHLRRAHPSHRSFGRSDLNFDDRRRSFHNGSYDRRAYYGRQFHRRNFHGRDFRHGGYHNGRNYYGRGHGHGSFRGRRY